MPNRIRPGARGRNVVIDDDLWEALGKAARQQGTDRTKVLNAAAVRYVKRHLPREQWPASHVTGHQRDPLVEWVGPETSLPADPQDPDIDAAVDHQLAEMFDVALAQVKRSGG